MSTPDRPLRILYVNHLSAMSGAEKSLLCLLEDLDRRQIEPFLAAPEGPLTERARDLNIECFDIPPLRPRRTRNPFRLLALASEGYRISTQLREIVGRKGIDLVHANSLVSAVITTGRPVGVPVIWHARDLRAPRTTVRQVVSRVQGVVAISQAVADWTAEVGTAAPTRVVYNALGPDDRHIARPRAKVREQWEMAPHTPLLGCAGQLVPWKRQDLFLRVGAEVIAQLPETRLVIIGSDLFNEHADYVQSLQTLALELGIAEHVLWLGQCEDMPSCLAALDLLVHTAEREPLGRVIMEAMAVGVPAAAFAEAGPAELITDGESGLLVPECDVSAMAQAAANVLTDHELALRLHDGCLARAGDFDAARQAALVLDFYRQVLGR